MFPRLLTRLEQILPKLEVSLDDADEAVGRVEVNVFDILKQVKEILKEGVSFRIEIGGVNGWKKIPVKIIMEPDEDETRTLEAENRA